MPTLHPRGINHLALATTDMKAQLTFWCDVLGLPLKALYRMHGVPGAFHGFVELRPHLAARVIHRLNIANTGPITEQVFNRLERGHRELRVAIEHPGSQLFIGFVGQRPNDGHRAWLVG